MVFRVFRYLMFSKTGVYEIIYFGIYFAFSEILTKKVKKFKNDCFFVFSDIFMFSKTPMMINYYHHRFAPKWNRPLTSTEI